jgi:class 3 adenylate cyclase
LTQPFLSGSSKQARVAYRQRDFRKLLEKAEGESKFVIALNLDIRGFSDWSDDPAQSVLYLKKLYMQLYDMYFSEASLVKPTGDGLMVVFDFKEEDLTKLAPAVVENAIEIVESFGTITQSDQMVNFPVPDQVGIGIARGSASRLASGNRTLDYSGRVLNLASRLMDIARPHGLVIDDAYGFGLLEGALKKRFFKDTVYLKGVSPHSPLSIRYWPDDITIPETNKHPVDEPLIRYASTERTLAELQIASDRILLDLPSRPPDPDSLEGRASHAKVLPGRRKSDRHTIYHDLDVGFQEKDGCFEAVINVPSLLKTLEKANIRSNWPVTIKVSYRAH